MDRAHQLGERRGIIEASEFLLKVPERPNSAGMAFKLII